MLSRRNVLVGAAASALLPASSLVYAADMGRDRALAAAMLRKDSLAASAARLGILFGTAAEEDVLDKDPAYAQAVSVECSLIVPEGSLKARVTRARQDGFDFSRADRLANFAADRNMAFRGHTLIWYLLPDWVESAIKTPQQARTELLLEVTEPCRHFRGRIDSWDVVNEPIALWDNEPGGFRNNFWYRMIGRDYVALAFTAARQADPNALLVLNENSVECDLPYHEQKRKDVLDLLRILRRDGVPVDALGIEAHLGDPGRFPFNPVVFDRFLNSVQELGFKILITELDVTDKNLPPAIGARDFAVAGMLGTFLATVLRHRGVITVNTWALSDRYSWLATYAPRRDGLAVRPSVLDSNLMKKRAYSAVREAFDDAVAF